MALPELTREAPARAVRTPREVTVTRIGRAVVEADAVSRRFGRRAALENVSLQVREGEIHALLGPNGAGKTTLLRILSGLTAPHDGSVRVLGSEVVGVHVDHARDDGPAREGHEAGSWHFHAGPDWPPSGVLPGKQAKRGSGEASKKNKSRKQQPGADDADAPAIAAEEA
jgi:energy-coupling factor transporter ATP-binding protein EcfA2